MVTATQPRILAAEDSPTQAAILRAYLERAGFSVAVATNGAEALALIAAEPFDLVLSDVVMPDVDGYDVCRAVKSRHPRVPVVLLTALDDPLDVVNALAAGADNFLRKPYQADDLVQRIRSLLLNKELRDSGKAQMGLELSFLGRRFMVNSEREQILDLLVSTFEDLVHLNERLRYREDELARARDELTLRLQEAELERDRATTILRAIPGPMAVFDETGRVVEVNEALCELLGRPASEVRGAEIWDLATFTDHAGIPVPRMKRALHVALEEGRAATVGTRFDVFLRRGGDVIPVVAAAEPIVDGRGTVVGAVGRLEDLRALMRHDRVTGLPSRDSVIDLLEDAGGFALDRDTSTALAVVVVDQFDRLRDSLPRQASDHVLKVAAERLRTIMSSGPVRRRCPNPSVASLDNGEMAIVLPDLADGDDALVIAAFLLEQMTHSVEIEGVDVELTVTVAVETCQNDDDPAAVVGAVAAAARRASRSGGRCVLAGDESAHDDVVAFLRRESELRRALTTGQLVVHYQPELRLRDDAPVAVEALVRWQHPEEGLLGAAEVIPLAQDVGLLADVSWYVLERAAVEVAGWRRDDRRCAAMSLSVNVVAQQLADSDFAPRVAAVLERAGLDPDALVLEVTEGTVMEDPGDVVEHLNAIKALGVQIAVDDFGTGYSSLLQLRRLPVDLLKVDRSFVSGMLTDQADAAIVAGTLRLARALGLEVVAEGVESVDTLVQLRLLGCDLGQGYHWAKPMNAADLLTWWAEQSERPQVGYEYDGALADTDERHDEAIAYLVHELRSPLAVIRGYAELLGESHGSLRHTQAIVRNVQELDRRLAALEEANDVLRGGLTLRSTLCDLAETIRALVDDLAPQLAPHPVTVEVIGGSVVAEVDRHRIVQALSNLLSNAAKFSPAQTPIEVLVASEPKMVSISVRDHGPGVPDHRRRELFRRFSRLGARSKGMGLGLYLSRLVVEAHGGDLVYEPAAGGGAIFSIRIPRRCGLSAETQGAELSGRS